MTLARSHSHTDSLHLVLAAAMEIDKAKPPGSPRCTSEEVSVGDEPPTDAMPLTPPPSDGPEPDARQDAEPETGLQALSGTTQARPAAVQTAAPAGLQAPAFACNSVEFVPYRPGTASPPLRRCNAKRACADPAEDYGPPPASPESIASSCLDFPATRAVKRKKSAALGPILPFATKGQGRPFTSDLRVKFVECDSLSDAIMAMNSLFCEPALSVREAAFSDLSGKPADMRMLSASRVFSQGAGRARAAPKEPASVHDASQFASQMDAWYSRADAGWAYVRLMRRSTNPRFNGCYAAKQRPSLIASGSVVKIEVIPRHEIRSVRDLKLLALSPRYKAHMKVAIVRGNFVRRDWYYFDDSVFEQEAAERARAAAYGVRIKAPDGSCATILNRKRDPWDCMDVRNLVN